MKRTIYTPNVFEIDGDVCKIWLYNKKCDKVAETIIDTNDFDKCNWIKWFLGKTGYAMSKKHSYLGRYVYPGLLKSGELLRYVNGDTLDNRKANLALSMRNQPNEYIIKDNLCFISIYDRKDNKIAEAIIDSDDYELCSSYKWGVGLGYVKDNGAKVHLHRLLLGLNRYDKQIVDHIDQNPLNNRRCNLRLCSHQQNHWNSTKQENNTSGYKGVHWGKDRKKWSVNYKSSNGRQVFVGRFLNIKDAAKAYNEAIKIERGEFAYLNEIKD